MQETQVWSLGQEDPLEEDMTSEDIPLKEGLSLKKEERRDKSFPPSSAGSRNKPRDGKDVAGPEGREGRLLQRPNWRVLRSYAHKRHFASKWTMWWKWCSMERLCADMNWGSAKCKEDGRRFLKSPGWEIFACVQADSSGTIYLFTLPPSRLIKYETKKLHLIWLCGLRSHLDT